MGRNGRYRFCVVLMLGALVLSLFASCGGDATPPDQVRVEFPDALGRQVILAEQPARVAALLGSFADVWLLVGGEICAAPEDAITDFGLDLPHAVQLGGAHSPNLEALLAAEPDFVRCWCWGCLSSPFLCPAAVLSPHPGRCGRSSSMSWDGR